MPSHRRFAAASLGVAHAPHGALDHLPPGSPSSNLWRLLGNVDWRGRGSAWLLITDVQNPISSPVLPQRAPCPASRPWQSPSCWWCLGDARGKAAHPAGSSAWREAPALPSPCPELSPDRLVGAARQSGPRRAEPTAQALPSAVGSLLKPNPKG